MQAIAREMNLSETVFIQKPTDNRALARLRIFTTTRELPLAGHPVIGTWFLLAGLGVVPAQKGAVQVWQQTRSEEHTSELQSRLHLVCRLLLEKKKKQNVVVYGDDSFLKTDHRKGPYIHKSRIDSDTSPYEYPLVRRTSRYTKRLDGR